MGREGTALRDRAAAAPPAPPGTDAAAPLPVDFGEWRAQLVAGLIAGGPAAILAALGLLGLMVVGSAVMWIGMPVLWLWLASHLQHGLTPSIGPYLLIAIGLPITMIVVAKGLKMLDRAFSRLAGFGRERNIPLPWMRSLRDGRGLGRRATVLDFVMIVSVLLAGAAFGLWFFFIGGAPPSSVGNGGLHP